MALAQGYLDLFKTNGHDVGSQAWGDVDAEMEAALVAYDTSGVEDDYITCMDLFVIYMSQGNTGRSDIIRFNEMIATDYNTALGDTTVFRNGYLIRRYGH